VCLSVTVEHIAHILFGLSKHFFSGQFLGNPDTLVRECKTVVDSDAARDDGSGSGDNVQIIRIMDHCYLRFLPGRCSA